MSAPLRLLSVSILVWAGLRATTLGALPGFTVSPARAVPPPIVRTDLGRAAAGECDRMAGGWSMPLGAPPQFYARRR
jgi:hypothetical protein